MKLDPRIKEGCKPLDCLDAENETVKLFIGKKGYFGDHISEFTDVSDLKEDVLTGIIPNAPDYEVYKASCARWERFLPAEWVKPEEPEEPKKTYRPFSLNELSELYAIGDVVTLRFKNCKVFEQLMLIGFRSSDDEDAPGKGYVFIGNCIFSLMELFNNFELKYLNHWQPFGAEENE